MQKRILVVAHAADIVETIPITLELAGHKVDLAGCGLDAILWAEIEKPDLILVDAVLPDMDGSAVVRILQRLPSTSALATFLLNRRRENGSLASSKLLQEVAGALAFCHATRPENSWRRGPKTLDAIRVATTNKSGFPSQTLSRALINLSNN
jgi:CheY-like chemotaxis protein